MSRRQTASPRRTNRIGRCGESLACRALTQAGYRVVTRNLRTRHGEIDALCRLGRCWIAVEVKSSASHPAPERCIRPGQLDRIERALRSLAPSLRPRARELRVDVVAVAWTSHAHHEPPRAKLRHFIGFRRAPAKADAIGFSRNTPASKPLRSNYLDTARSFPLPMVNLAEQMIPRRKLLLLLSENALFMLVILVGTTAPPLSSRSCWLFEPSHELLRGLATSFAIAVFCQTALNYNDLYDWKVSQNRADLANRLVHSYGYALVILGVVALVAGQLFFLPGLEDINQETWKLILLVGVGFGLVFVLRHLFHWLFYKWRFGERVIVIGSSPEALHLSRMLQNNPLACPRLRSCGARSSSLHR